jgi:hypothetical protein
MDLYSFVVLSRQGLLYFFLCRFRSYASTRSRAMYDVCGACSSSTASVFGACAHTTATGEFTCENPSYTFILGTAQHKGCTSSLCKYVIIQRQGLRCRANFLEGAQTAVKVQNPHLASATNSQQHHNHTASSSSNQQKPEVSMKKVCVAPRECDTENTVRSSMSKPSDHDASFKNKNNLKMIPWDRFRD